MKLKLKGVRNITLLDPIDPDPNGEYLLALIVSPDGKYVPSKQGEEEPEETLHFKVVRPESLNRIGDKLIRIRRGATPSQVLRASIWDYLKRIGKETTEDEYSAVMDKLIDSINEKGQ